MVVTQITIKDLLMQSTGKYQNNPAFQIKRDLPAGRQGEKYVIYSFADVKSYTTGLIRHLIGLGIKKGDKIAVLAENRPEWAMSYLAIAAMGAVVVPLDALGTETELKGIIAHSEAKALITSDKFYEMMENTPTIKFIISMDRDFDQFKQKECEEFGYEVNADDIAAIVYTSGTTGIPKGVMLTHGNIMSNVVAICGLEKILATDKALSVLPIHHTLETTAGFLSPFYVGATVTHAESLKSFKLLNNMVETKTTVLVGVPMLYQLFYDGIMRGVEEKGRLFTILFKTMLFISRSVKIFLRINIGRILFGTIHRKFGGHFRFWVSGGAAIDPDLIRNFDLMGFTILQGYGLTESSPVISAESLSVKRIGSVGNPIPAVQVKLVDGEILASGPNIMLGYFKMKEETDKVLKDGWLYTGDIGRIDKDGYLYITGRIKDVIITSSGLNVYPDEVEFELNKTPYIKESCVIGKKVGSGVKKGSEEVFAVVAPNMEYFEKMGFSTDENSVFSAVWGAIEKLNNKLAQYKRISGLEVRYTDFPKTSTRKIKRFEVRKEMEELWKK